MRIEGGHVLPYNVQKFGGSANLLVNSDKIHILGLNFTGLLVNLDEISGNRLDYKIHTQPNLLNFNEFHQICK
jgi:hypothetical protein